MAGQRVLLAEDNPVNQQVAQELLFELGLEVLVADNGRIALQQLRQERVDLVLMDVQMPELDGIETTRLIKGDSALAALPVVALTAHAMAQDRERFLAAGMDDYLSKPIEARDLRRVLSRWLRVDALPTEAEASLAASTGAALPDWPGMDLDAALARLNGKRALLWRLLDEFRGRHVDSAEELRQLCTDGQLQTAAERTHAIKGAAATLGADALADAARSLEHALQRNEPTDAALRELAKELARLQALPLANMPGSSPGVGKFDNVEQVLESLSQALREQRFEAIRLLDQLPPDWGDSGPMRALRTALDRLDFEQAQAQLEGLRSLLAEQVAK
jgi:CheY-like chemotaxis protein